MFSERFLEWIEWAIIIQLIAIFIFIIGLSIAKIHIHWKHSRQKKVREKLLSSLRSIQAEETVVREQILNQCRNNIEEALSVIAELDVGNNSSRHWQNSKSMIAQNALLPIARKFAYNKSWFKRYLATQCFDMESSTEDEAIIIDLINDPVLLVSLNAAEIVVHKPTQKMVDTLIDNLADNRHIRQTSFAQILSKHSPHIDHFFIDRLSRDENTYIKAFCYRILTNLPVDAPVYVGARKDANDENLELSIAALKYLTHVNTDFIVELLCEKLDSEAWQMREKAVSLLGKLNATSAISLIGQKLKDKEWWVRAKAADSLARMGEKGIAILKQQDEESDRYAYQAAQLVLKTMS